MILIDEKLSRIFKVLSCEELSTTVTLVPFGELLMTLFKQSAMVLEKVLGQFLYSKAAETND